MVGYSEKVWIASTDAHSLTQSAARCCLVQQWHSNHWLSSC